MSDAQVHRNAPSKWDGAAVDRFSVDDGTVSTLPDKLREMASNMQTDVSQPSRLVDEQNKMFLVADALQQSELASTETVQVLIARRPDGDFAIRLSGWAVGSSIVYPFSDPDGLEMLHWNPDSPRGVLDVRGMREWAARQLSSSSLASARQRIAEVVRQSVVIGYSLDAAQIVASIYERAMVAADLDPGFVHDLTPEQLKSDIDRVQELLSEVIARAGSKGFGDFPF